MRKRRINGEKGMVLSITLDQRKPTNQQGNLPLGSKRQIFAIYLIDAFGEFHPGDERFLQLSTLQLENFSGLSVGI